MHHDEASGAMNIQGRLHLHQETVLDDVSFEAEIKHNVKREASHTEEYATARLCNVTWLS